MKTNSTLNNAMFNFAFTGVMQPHRRVGEAEPIKLALKKSIPKRS
jgi:hypothetical protein